MHSRTGMIMNARSSLKAGNHNEVTYIAYLGRMDIFIQFYGSFSI